MKKKLYLFLAVLLITTIGTASNAFGYTYVFTNSDSSVNSEYNRQNAADYAVQYARKPGNSSYASYGSSELGGDCTNFVSQVLKGGSMSFHGTKGQNRNTIDWYYYGPNVPPATSPRTSSWTGAKQFLEHWGTLNGTGGQKAYQQVSYTKAEAIANFDRIYTELWKGDILQFCNSTGAPYHSIVIWNYGTPNGVKTMNFAQHSTDAGTWDWALDLESKLNEIKNDPGYVITLKMKNSGA